jgi:orotate phosphoribosyltransferase
LDSRKELLDLIRSQALLRGKFVLSSGRTSDYYIDARQVTLSGVGSRLIGRVVFDRIKSDLPDAVAGMSLGADPVVTAVTVTSAELGRPVDGLLIRKQAKPHGTGRRVEGPVRRGMTAVVVEDTSTTGASAVQAAAALSDEGVSVSRVISLIDRGEGAASTVAKAGLHFDCVFSVGDILVENSSASDVNSAAGKSQAAPAMGAAQPGTRMILQTDGASAGNPGPAGAGYVIFDESGKEIARGSRPLGRATNNVAEYQALLLGLAAAASKGATDLTVRLDSEFVVKQMLGQYRVKHPDMQPLHQQARQAASAFSRIRFEHVPRNKNRIADGLATRAAAEQGSG